MTGRGKLSDAELSKKLGHYQKMSRIWILPCRTPRSRPS